MLLFLLRTCVTCVVGATLSSAEASYMPAFAVAYDNHCFHVYKKVSHLPSQLGIFVFTFRVKCFHIYAALLHLALKVFTFTGPYYIFTFRGATLSLTSSSVLY